MKINSAEISEQQLLHNNEEPNLVYNYNSAKSGTSCIYYEKVV